MAITYAAALQNRIALMLSRRQYSELTANQKIAIDNNWTVGTVGGAAGSALETLGQVANAFTVSDTTDTNIPATWSSWFVSEAALQAAPAFPTAEVNDIRRNNALARRDALLSYSRSSFDNTATGDIGALTIQSIRANTIIHALRMSPSVYLDVAMVDDAIETVVTEIWNETDWGFKTKLVTLTIGTDASVTASDNVAVDKLIGDRIDYDTAFGGFAISVDYQTILDYKASSASDGKPLYFHLLRAGSELNWIFERTPDKQYTAKAMVTAQTPSMSSQATMNTALGSFPVDFHGVIKDRVLMVVMERIGRARGVAGFREKTDSKIHGLLARYDASGGEPQWSEYNNVRPFGLGWNPGHIGGAGL